jgi:hypothetical protein
MRRGQAAAAVVIILIIAWAVGRWLALALVAVVFAAVYLVAVKTHPRGGCPACKGNGRFYHPIFRWQFRLCASCGGNGRRITPGAAAFGTPEVRAQAAVETQARAERRRKQGPLARARYR